MADPMQLAAGIYEPDSKSVESMPGGGTLTPETSYDKASNALQIMISEQVKG